MNPMYRLGLFAGRHRGVVVIVWVLLAAALIGVISQVGAVTNNDLSLPGTDSQRAFDLLAKDFPPQQNGSSPIVFHASTGTVTSPDAKAAIQRAFHSIEKAPHVNTVVSPFSQQGQAQLSDDKKTALVTVLLSVYGSDLTVEVADDILDRALPARAAGLQVAAGGPIGSTLSQPATESSEIVGIVAAMVILTLVFGSLVAMGMPILTAVIGLSVGLSAIGLLGHLFNVPSVAPTLATMIGLGVGIDYALFIVNRHRENLRGGVDVVESLGRTDATSGGAVVFAGGTVVIALVSLMVAGIPLISALGYASAIAVFTAIVASITLLPALLGIAGRHVFSLQVPAFLRPKGRPLESQVFARWARTIARRPLVAVIASLIVLVPLAIPLASLQLGQEDVGVTPLDTTERQAYDLISAGFGPGYNGPLVVATQLGTPAEPSAKFHDQKHEALALQRKLGRQKRHANHVQRRQRRIPRILVHERRRSSATPGRASRGAAQRARPRLLERRAYGARSGRRGRSRAPRPRRPRPLAARPPGRLGASRTLPGVAERRSASGGRP